MASYVNIDGFRDDQYFARSWAILTREKGWFGQIVLLWLAALIPIVGPLWVLGYLSERGRLVAWGVATSPRENGVTVGACIGSGWRAFLVMLGWGIAYAVVVGILEAIPFVGAIFLSVSSIISLAVGIIITAAVIRATIYQKIGGGYTVSNIFKMVENDAAGLLRILGINFIGLIIIGTLVTVVFLAVFIPSAGTFLADAEAIARLTDADPSTIDTEDFRMILGWLASLVAPLSAGVFIAALPATILQALVYIAVGLWIRQYNVPAWGGMDDPLPSSTPSYQQQYQYPPSTPYQQPPAGQVPYGYGDTDYGTQTHGGVGQTYDPNDPNQQQ